MEDELLGLVRVRDAPEHDWNTGHRRDVDRAEVQNATEETLVNIDVCHGSKRGLAGSCCQKLERAPHPPVREGERVPAAVRAHYQEETYLKQSQ